MSSLFSKTPASTQESIYLSLGAESDLITVLHQRVHAGSFTEVNNVTQLLLLPHVPVPSKCPYICCLTGIIKKKPIHNGKIMNIEEHSSEIL